MSCRPHAAFTRLSGIVLALVIALAAPTARAGHMEFTPGAVYVTVFGSPKSCFGPYPDTIWEFNPATNQWRLFATTPSDMGCATFQALAFTPDGSRLRVADSLGSRIWEIDADGNITEALNADDLVRTPIGRNAIGYDLQQNFYNLNFGGPRGIIRHPAEGGPPEIFADVDDGIVTSGSLAFPTDGAVYYAADSISNQILRFAGPHQVSVFDTIAELDVIESIVADELGNLYLFGIDYSTQTGLLYRYRAGEPQSRELLRSLPDSFATMALSGDAQTLYVAMATELAIVDLQSLDTVFVPIPLPFDTANAGFGAAVYVPEPGTVVMVGLLGLVVRARRRRWSAHIARAKQD